MELNQVTLPAINVAASVAFYRQMGFALVVVSAHYARFKSTVGNATFSVHGVDAMASLRRQLCISSVHRWMNKWACSKQEGYSLCRNRAMSRGCGVRLGW